jgi:hypothetical protein
VSQNRTGYSSALRLSKASSPRRDWVRTVIAADAIADDSNERAISPKRPCQRNRSVVDISGRNAIAPPNA